MKNISVLIVEDEWIVSEEIMEVLTQSGYNVVGQVEDGNSALDILKEKEVDVALLDINIKGVMDGIELAHDIVKEFNCAIIFLTAFDDDHFINRAKKVKPAAYIVKPYQARNLEMAIEMAFNNLLASENPPKNESFFMPDYVFVKENSRFLKVRLEDIYFAEAVGSYTDIHIESGKKTVAINLKAFESSIDSSVFLRVHRSYLVNLSHIGAIDGNRVFINEKPIPISSSHKNELMERFKFI